MIPEVTGNGWLALFLVLGGPFVGSFVSASACGWPKPGNLSAGRSHCSACGHTLRLAELVPVLSFLAQRGKCAACGAPIARQHIVAELASALIAISAVLLFSGWMMLASFFLGEILLFIALVDFRTRLIPDGAVYTLITAGLALAFLRHGQAGLLSSLGGAIAGYGAFWLVAFAYHRLRGRDGLGLGDAKLLAGAGAWLGPFALPWVVLLAASGALVVLLARRRGNLRRDTPLSFGPFMGLAIYGLWLWGAYGFFLWLLP